MSITFTNENDISLPLAVWLSADDYDFVGGKNVISATSLLKSTRQVVLAPRVPVQERDYDVSDFIASRLGHAIHDSIERSWEVHYRSSLKKLGYPEKIIDRVIINPPESMDITGLIPIYLEQRASKDINGFTISGKFDMVIEGQLYDFKSTSVYAHILGNRDDKYIQQASIYRWLNPEIITKPQIHIEHLFTDWSRAQSRTVKDYPPNRLMSRQLDLMSLEETEKFIIEHTNAIRKYWNAPDEDIPFCTDEELWRSDPVYKYYSNPDKTDGRSTKNFSSLADANKYKAEKGKGIVITVPGQVKACAYCAAFPVCKQKDLYEHDI